MQKKFWKGHCQQDRQGMMSAINCLLEPSAWSLSDTSTAQTEATVRDPGFVLCDFSLCSFCSPKALVFLLHTACCPPTCRHRQAQMPKQCFLHVNSLKKKKADLLDYMHLTVLPLKEVFFWTLFKNSDFFFLPNLDSHGEECSFHIFAYSPSRHSTWQTEDPKQMSLREISGIWRAVILASLGPATWWLQPLPLRVTQWPQGALLTLQEEFHHFSIYFCIFLILLYWLLCLLTPRE